MSLPLPEDETPDLAHVYALLLDQGDALTRLTANLAALKHVLSATPRSEPADPKAARMQRMEAMGWHEALMEG